jgi:hypothetical protein
MAWDRQINWRQGSAIDADQLVALGLLQERRADAVGVVISHDCDLTCGPAVESEVEIILGCTVSELSGHYTASKNARKLHLSCRDATGAAVYVELLASEKKRINKEQLVTTLPSPARLILAPGQHLHLKRWLGARYDRPAFPEQFEARLKGAKLDEKIAGCLAQTQQWVHAVLFDLDEGQQLEREPDELYVLDVYLLYSTEGDHGEGHRHAKTARAGIEAAFKRKLDVSGDMNTA